MIGACDTKCYDWSNPNDAGKGEASYQEEQRLKEDIHLQAGNGCG